MCAGTGSTLEFAQDAMAGLHVIINDIKKHHKLKKVRMLDVPCGDMQWMSHFLETRYDIIYTGFDIVPNIIEHHRKTYADRPWTFRNVDIASDSNFVNTFDIVLIRHMLQHLDYSAIFTILKKLSAETRQPSFLLASTFSSEQMNIELNTRLRGRCRFLNLELAPLRLEPPICLMHDGFHGPNYLGLWRIPIMTIPKPFCSQSKPTPIRTPKSVCLKSKSSAQFNRLSTASLYSCIHWKISDLASNL